MTSTAVKILSEFRNSSSLPVLVETSGGTRCVLKWKGGAEGPLVNAVDWICLKLARGLGIPAPKPLLITILPEFANAAADPDIKDLIQRSVGVNLGVEFLENTAPFKPDFSDCVDHETRSLIFLFDVLLLNIDRTDLNPNMVVAKNRVYCIDFASAMSVRMLMNGNSHNEQFLLNLVRRHPFYTTSARADAFPSPPDGTFITDMVRSMPEEWNVGGRALEDLMSGLKQLMVHSRPFLERRLAILETIPLESVESMRARALRNRKAFEEKLESDKKSRILEE